MLQGKGFFIWKIKDIEGGDADRAAAKAHDASLTHVLIKILSGTWDYNQRPVYDNRGRFKGWEDDILGPFVDAFKARGIEVWGWQYVYHRYAAYEADAANKRVKQFELDGFVIDAEGEVKHKKKEAAQYIDRLEVGVPVALSSYRYPVLHQELPWDVYLDGCDMVMPQVYWEMATNPGQQLKRSLHEYREFLDTNLPYVPTGSAYGRGAWHATPGQVLEFMQTAKDLKLPAVNFFRWGTAVEIPGMWETIAQFDYGSGPPPPEGKSVDEFVLEEVYPGMKYHWGYGGLPPVLG